ncbi:Pentatricopeptide repeat-containing protein [Cardamine amara subsp. amara]|uniref:Pentatricopeptide repeat-containing protein n=1 Tax=Cardamine amara subsp. amara TaxID=228776 RepID=A0ABD1C2A8_CARAN
MHHFSCVTRSLYDIFIRVFLDMGNLERANQLFQELKLSGDMDAVVKVNATFMEHWFKQRMDEKVMECYMSSKEEFSKIHVAAGNSLLKVLLRYGKKTEAWSLFSQMLEQSWYPGLEEEYRNTGKFDSESYNIMVNECFNLGQINEAMQIFCNVVGTISDPELCYRNVITKFCEQGMLSEAERCFAEMCSKKYLVPDVPTYRTMMDAYVKKVRINNARKTLNQTLDVCLTYIAKHV